jgi:hypothetical protein
MTTTDEVKVSPRRLTGLQRIAIEIAEYRDKAKLDSWNSFVEELKVPSELYPALLTSRPELVVAATPRAMNADECKIIYKLIGGLLETNAALREHTARVAQLAENLSSQMLGFQRVAHQIELFANFKNPEHEDAEDA